MIDEIPGMPGCLQGFDVGPGCWFEGNLKQSAVALLFIPPDVADVCRIVLIVRGTRVGSHRGQIGFAGGHADPGEETPAQTVRREVEEELGIPRQRLRVLGALRPEVDIRGRPVHPLVVYSDVQPSEFKLCAREVDDILILPWTALTADQNHRFSFNLFGQWRHSDCYQAQGRSIWGLTARIIAHACFS